MTGNERLKHERLSKSWSQGDVAREIGTNVFTVNRWEKGKAFPNPYFCRKLSDLYRKSPEELGLIREISGASVYDPLLPVALNGANSLIGRDPLLTQLKHRICASKNSALIALHGLPGIGKTALASALASDPEIKSHFPDKILWAGLGSKPNVLGELSRWGAELGISSTALEDPNSQEAWEKTLRTAIGRRRLLLVIDDAWDTQEALALRVGGSNCVHLLTTRFPQVALDVAAAEDVFRIPELTEADGVSLLAHIAPQVVAQNNQTAHELVRWAGALPLALTVMGNYLKTQSYSGQPRRLQAALERLQAAEERLRVSMPISSAERPPSHPAGVPFSLYAAIAVSDQHLSEQAREALRALSILPAKPNSFSEVAALDIAAVPDEVLDTLSDAGLLEQGGPGRYMLHQTIADYARLNRTNTAIEERMVAFFVSFIKDHQTNYNVLERETHNVQESLQYAFKREMSSALIAGAIAFAPFLEARGLNDIAQMHLKRAQQAALSSGDDLSLARICLHLGRIAKQHGEFLQAKEWYQKGLILARRIKHREIMCDLLTNIGELAVDRGKLKLARLYVQKGLGLARYLDDKQRKCILLENLGEIVDNHELFKQKDTFEQGDTFYLEALTLAREIEDREMICTLLQNLGAKAFYREDYTQVEQYYQEGLDLAREIGYQQRISALLTNMGIVAIKQKKFLEAQKYCWEGLEIARRIQNRWRICNALQNLGILEAARGKYEQGEKYLQESLDVARDKKYPYLIGENLCELGELYLKQHKIEEADNAFNEAYMLGNKIDNGWLFYSSLYGFARIKSFHNDISSALDLGQKSLRFYKAVDHYKKNEVESWLNTLPIER
jgi:tetratricopeptide (TPR) repeat protein/transcriptional regulator with XRE-family HTH domain